MTPIRFAFRHIYSELRHGSSDYRYLLSLAQDCYRLSPRTANDLLDSALAALYENRRRRLPVPAFGSYRDYPALARLRMAGLVLTPSYLRNWWAAGRETRYRNSILFGSAPHYPEDLRS